MSLRRRLHSAMPVRGPRMLLRLATQTTARRDRADLAAPPPMVPAAQAVPGRPKWRSSRPGDGRCMAHIAAPARDTKADSPLRSLAAGHPFRSGGPLGRIHRSRWAAPGRSKTPGPPGRSGQPGSGCGSGPNLGSGWWRRDLRPAQVIERLAALTRLGEPNGGANVGRRQATSGDDEPWFCS